MNGANHARMTLYVVMQVVSGIVELFSFYDNYSLFQE